ncbi:outer membrane autotransporter barrel domain-containing protein [Planoprotostelium fungivorum]|uniref:receptor protein-tyrosine kinase n=1 Tax=Planoprotostelium fungivorum TaxID=1890364 RepID=A0A2P6NFU1_9EUKA|nr:outer membrane autotransporter barrel domain-containing protein [Planoprotostelium fungivorum]
MLNLNFAGTYSKHAVSKPFYAGPEVHQTSQLKKGDYIEEMEQYILTGSIKRHLKREKASICDIIHLTTAGNNEEESMNEQSIRTLTGAFSENSISPLARMKDQRTYVLLILCITTVLASDRTAVFTDPNGVTYDLFALIGLGNSVGGDFFANATSYYYAWRPYSVCQQTPQSGCSGVQIYPGSSYTQCISYPNPTVTWSYDSTSGSAVWNGTGGLDGRLQIIRITCDSTIGNSISFSFVNESPILMYNFAIRLKCGYYFNSPYAGTISISSNSTSSNTLGLTTLWIAGSSYGTDTTQMSVRVGGQTCTIQSMDNFNIYCSLSPSSLSLGSYSVSLIYKGVTARSTPGSSIYLASASNATGVPTSGGASSITLYSFSPALLATCNNAPSLTVGSKPYSSSLSGSTLSFTMPAGSGVFPVAVTCGNTAVWGYFAYNPSVVYGVSQVTNPINPQVTIWGNNFGPTSGDIYQIWVGQNLCTNLMMITPHKVVNCTLAGTYTPTMVGNVIQNAIVVANGGDSVMPNVLVASTSGTPYYLGQNPELCRQKCISTPGCKSWSYDSCGGSGYACWIQNVLNTPSWATCRWGGQVITGAPTGQTSVTPVYMNNPFPSVQFIDRLNVLYNLDYYGDAQNSIGNVDFASSGYTFNPGNLGHAYSSSPASIWQTGNYPVMDPSTVSFSTNSSGTTILTGYAAVVGSCSRRPNMALLCDSTLPSPVLTFLGEYTICVYSFTFSFNCSQASTAPYFRSILASSVNTFASGDLYLSGQWGVNPNLISVMVAGSPCPLYTAQLNNSVLVCAAPPMLNATALITVVVNGQFARNGIYLWSVPIPAVFSVSSPLTSGGTLTITGCGFGRDLTKLTVTIGGSSCPVTSLSLNGTNIYCNISSGSGAGYSVSVRLTGLGELAPAGLQMSYAAPIISSTTLVPTVGSSMTITGASFGNNINQVTVQANGINCPVTSLSATTIVCTVVQGVGAVVPFTVIVNGVNSTSTFSYQSPTISAVATVDTPGGTVTITGTNLGNRNADVVVTIAGVTVTSNWISATSVTFSAPSGTGSGTFDLTVGGQITSSTFNYNPPTVTSVTMPDTVGGVVNITGTNFGTNPSLIRVTLQSTLYSPVSIVDSHTSISFIVNPGVGTNLAITVTVNSRASAAKTLNYNPPSVTSISSVSTDGGAAIITGKNFGPAGTAMTVSVNSITYTGITTINHTTCSVSIGSGVGSNYPVSVTVSGQTSLPLNIFAYRPPVMTSSSVTLPTMGPSTVVITGQNFGTVNSLVNVSLNGVNCGSVLIYNSTYLTCSVSNGAGGTSLPAGITVGNQMTNNPSFFSFQPPLISSVTPVGTNGGIINVTGANFGNNVQLITVTVGAVACTSVALVTSHTLIQCNLPGGTGSAALTVTVNGQSNSAYTYTYLPPTVTLTSQPSTIGGTLTITGLNFGSTLADISVTLCTSVQFNTVNSINCTVSSGSGYNIGRVITVKGQSTSFTFSYAPPLITSVTNPPTQGDVITILGSQFTPTSTVTYDGNSCLNVIVGPLLNNITCTAPPGTGSAQLIVSCGNQSVSTMTQYLPPIITSTQSITPSGGTMQLNGQNLGSNSSLISIVIGTLTCSNVQIVTAHQIITCVLPAGVGGNLTSTITVDSLPASFLYSFSPPIFTSATAGPTLGGVVTITGTNLGSQPSQIIVTVNGKSCSGVNIVKANTISCQTAPGTGSNLPLSLSVGGQLTTGTFSYLSPTISSASSSGPPGGIYLSGSNFGNNVSVINVTVTNTADNSVTLCGGYVIINPSLTLNCTTVSGASPTSSYTVQIVVDGQVSPSVTYTITAPRVDSISSAPTNGGLITITGSGFSSDATVTVGGNPCNITLQSQTLVNCTVGPMTDSRSLTVILTSSGISVSGIYTYLPPNITSTTKVPTAGGNIIINGTNFPASSSQISVLVNGAYCYPVDILLPFYSIRCRAVGGTGTNLPVNVSVSGSAYTSTVMSYLPPAFFNASSGPTIGGLITIYGSQFGNDPTALVITANGALCQNPSIVSPSTTISCTTVAGTGAVKSLTIVVGGQSTSGTFSYLPPTPQTTTTVATSGGLVTISGSNFGTSSSVTSVTINGQTCLSPTTTSSYTTITCTAQPDVGTLLRVSITVDGLSGSANIFSFLPPLVNSITSTPTAGGLVIVDGANFGTKSSAIAVAISGVSYPVNVLVDHTRISFVASNGTLSASINLTVQGQSVLSTLSYLPPNITLVTSPRTSGTNITITGTNFGSSAGLISVVFPSASGDITVKDVTILTPHTLITCVAPSGTGTRPVRVIVNTLSSLVYNFHYQPPIVTTTTPLNSTGGTLTITGDNFGQLSSLVQVTVGAVICSSIVINTAYTVITCSLPPNIIGATIPISVVVDGLTGQSTYRSQPPFLFSTSSPPTSGGPIQLTGINFGGNANLSVIVNGQPCLINTASDSVINCNATRSGNSHPTGSIYSVGQTTVIPYVPYQGPSITSISRGEPNGGTVTVSGSNFGIYAGYLSVAMDGIPCTDVDIISSDYNITCTVPPASGPQRSAIITVDGISSSPFTFTYFSPVVSQASSVSTRGNITTLSGLHFGDGKLNSVSVTINGSDCPIASSSATIIECSVGAGVGANLTGTITVYNITSQFLLSYLPPTVSSVSSTNTTGGVITISGDNFGVDASLISANVNGLLQCSSIVILAPHTTISCQLDPGSGSGLPLSVSVAGSTGTGAYSYLPPIITSITSPPTVGGTVTFVGVNFGSNADKIQAYFNGQICRYVTIITRSYSFSCTVANATGSVQAYVIVDSLVSYNVNTSYLGPIITKITPAPQSGGYLYITGANFGTDIDAITISLPCRNTSVYSTVPETLSCYLSYDILQNVTFKVTVSGKSTNFTAIIRELTPALFDQYSGVIRLMANASSTITRPTQNFCFNFSAIQCSPEGNIRSLNLSSVSLSTSFDGLCNLLYLEELYLRSVRASGTIPACLNSLVTLKVIDLGANAIQGSIPDVSDLSQLTTLLLDHNSLEGSIPSTLGNNPLSAFDVSSNNIVGSVPSELTSLPSLSLLKLSDNYLSGFVSTIPPANNISFSCDITSNFLACPIPSWVSIVCSGICGQATVRPSMNVTREILRAVYSQTSSALFYFSSGTYNNVTVRYFSAGQNVSFVSMGDVVISGSSRFTFSDAVSVSIGGFSFHNGPTVTLSLCPSVSIVNARFYGASDNALSIISASQSISLSNCSFSANSATPVIIASAASSNLFVSGCSFVNNAGQAMSVSGSIQQMTVESCNIQGNVHSLMGTIGITATVRQMSTSHVTWYNNSASSGAALYASAAVGSFWASDVDARINVAYLEGGAFVFASSVQQFWLQNSRFQNNSAQTGGAISFKSTSSNVTMRNTSFIYHTASQGSAINFDGIAVANQISFTSVNVSQSDGQRGAVHLPAVGNSTFIDCIFDENVGGSLYGSLYAGSVSCVGSSFSNNTASEGSGIALYGTATSVSVTESNFYGNEALSQGADITIEMTLASLYIQNSTFIYSTARFQGAAVNIGASAKIQNVSLIGVTIQSCDALFGSGLAVAGTCPTVTVRDSRFIENSATFEGAAIFVGDRSAQSVSIVNSKFEGNFASSGGAVKYTGGGSNAVLVIDGSSFTYNEATSSTGGAVIVQKSVGNLSVTNSFFGNNQAQSGGAIYLTQSIPVQIVFQNNTFDSNIARSTGGALSNEGSSGSAVWIAFVGKTPLTFLFAHSIISQSISSVSGALLLSSPVPSSQVSVVSVNSTWTQNRADFNGGGILLSGLFVSVDIQESVFSYNNATTGGGISVEAVIGQINIDSSSFVYNLATQIAGAISASSSISSLSLYNSTLSNNIAPSGGAIYNLGVTTMTIASCDISYNLATGTFGGALLYQPKTNVQPSLSIYNSTVRGNTAKNGGGLYLSPATAASFSESYNTFSDNAAMASGGAVAVSGEISSVVSRGSVWMSNTASDGAALYSTSPSSTFISGASFTNNSATNNGGAVSSVNAGNTSIVSCSFSTNKAGGSGGGISVSIRSATKRAAFYPSDKVFLSDLTFVDNKGGSGGGVSMYTPSTSSAEGTMLLQKSLFQSNGATNGGGVATSTGSSITNVKFDKNQATSGSAFAITNSPGDVSLSNIDYGDSQGAAVPSNVTLQGDGANSLAVDCGKGYTSVSNNGVTTCEIAAAVPSGSQGIPTPIIIGIAVAAAFIVIVIIIVAAVLIRNRTIQSRMRPAMEFDLQSFTTALPKSTIINESELKNLVQIGRGAFGVVYKAQWRSADVAVKQLLNQDLLAKEQVESFVHEVQLLERLRPHPNVVLFLGVIPPPNLALVTEFCEGGDLLSYILKQDPDIEMRKSFIMDIAVGMLHLHNENIIHRDLAARNILLTSALRCKVTDFGFSRETESSEEQTKTTSVIGPLKWMAPEALTEKVYSNKSDVYSFAITMWEIVTGEDPYANRNVINVAIEVAMNGLRPTVPSDLDDNLAKLMRVCWDRDAANRPDFEAICAYLTQMRADSKTLALDEPIVFDTYTPEGHYSTMMGPDR